MAVFRQSARAGTGAEWRRWSGVRQEADDLARGDVARHAVVFHRGVGGDAAAFDQDVELGGGQGTEEGAVDGGEPLAITDGEE